MESCFAWHAASTSLTDMGLLAGLIDVHHTKPVHTMQLGEKTKVLDLALLCPNCHRVVHSKRQWLTIDQVRKAFETSGRTSLT
jgi:5-methylcytosine-specific restriction enzyme A